MKITLKTTILLSTGLAVSLNVWQFLDSLSQKKDAYAVSDAYTTSHPTTQAPSQKQPRLVQASPDTPPASPTPSVSPSAPANAPTTDSNPTIAAIAAKLTANGLKPDYAALYLDVQHSTGTPWQILAAVHKIETGQGGNTTRTSYAGATGPMQFLPSTFRSYAVDGDGNGTRDITDLDDAMHSAGRYLAANGAARGQYSNALYHYNHSNTYVSTVLDTARHLGL